MASTGSVESDKVLLSTNVPADCLTSIDPAFLVLLYL